MDPSLGFVDRATGDLIGQLRLEAELHQLSIRHMAVDARHGCGSAASSAGDATRHAAARRLRDAATATSA